MKFQLLLIVLVFGLFSCEKVKTHETNPLSLFNDKASLSHQIFPVPSDSLSYVLQMLIIDSLMILKDKMDPFLFSLINLNSKKMLNRFGNIGKGPGEFSTSTWLSRIPGKPRTLGINDRRMWTYHEIQLDSAIGNDQYSENNRVGSFSMKYDILVKMQDSLFIGIGVFDKRYAISDMNGEIKKLQFAYPFEEKLKKHSKNNIAFTNQGKLIFNPAGNKFVLTTYNAANLEICEVSGGELVKIKDVYTVPPDFEAESNPNILSIDLSDRNRYGYKDLAVTEKYIYALYSGRSKEEFTGREREIYFGKDVLVFDWAGNPVIHYQLDSDVSTIGVSEDDKNLYAFSQDNEGQPLILNFELP